MYGEQNWFSFSVCVCLCACTYLSIWDMKVCFFSVILSFRLGFQFSYLAEILSSSLFVGKV